MSCVALVACVEEASPRLPCGVWSGSPGSVRVHPVSGECADLSARWPVGAPGQSSRWDGGLLCEVLCSFPVPRAGLPNAGSPGSLLILRMGQPRSRTIGGGLVAHLSGF